MEFVKMMILIINHSITRGERPQFKNGIASQTFLGIAALHYI